MTLDTYYLLGRSGLRVSRLALGTLTFGTDGAHGAWGVDATTARGVFDRYLAAGGNFIDTADLYTRGTSETMLGAFLAESGSRDRVVLASKFSYSLDGGDPNAGGNSRKNMLRAVEASLRRLRTDYLDLYLLHTWDRMTPAEEVMRAFDDLVRAGKIRYAGLSDVPAWYAARAQTFAETHALAPIINLQLPYSLVDRGIEHEFQTLAQQLGMGITAWGPLAFGLLSGKYRPSTATAAGAAGEGRLTGPTGSRMGLFTDANWRIVRSLEEVATALDRSMAQVALNWVANRPGVAAVILGASKLAQLDDNLGALDFTIPDELRATLEAASAPAPGLLYGMLDPAYQRGLHAGLLVESKPPGY